MKILILGSGAREYSIALAIKKEQESHELFFAPGNGATHNLGTNLKIKQYSELVSFAKQNEIDFTIVGPEAPLVDGVVDIFENEGLVIFGPRKNAARLEGSKVFMKNFLKKYNIPTAKYIETSSKEEAIDFANRLSTPLVIKADGLCAGKGVIIATSHQEAKEAIEGMLSGESFGDAGKRVIVEEYLDGYELSVFAICDGKDYIILPAAQDHKRVGDGDTGPNTGGMGAYAPTPLVDEDIYQFVKKQIVEPTLDGMKKEDSEFKGVLFIGLMIVDKKPFVLEYNVRFGDPECEILMPLVTTPLSQFLYKAAVGELSTATIELSSRHAVGVVMASENYPYGSSKPAEIIVDEIVDEDLAANAHISYAGVSLDDGKLMATGGRVLVCVGLGESINEARDRAYNLCGQVHFVGKKLRSDIAYQALGK
jgi:phosphoribosylamine--glycine ligase